MPLRSGLERDGHYETTHDFEILLSHDADRREEIVALVSPHATPAAVTVQKRNDTLTVVAIDVGRSPMLGVRRHAGDAEWRPGTTEAWPQLRAAR